LKRSCCLRLIESFLSFLFSSFFFLSSFFFFFFLSFSFFFFFFLLSFFFSFFLFRFLFFNSAPQFLLPVLRNGRDNARRYGHPSSWLSQGGICCGSCRREGRGQEGRNRNCQHSRSGPRLISGRLLRYIPFHNHPPLLLLILKDLMISICSLLFLLFLFSFFFFFSHFFLFLYLFFVLRFSQARPGSSASNSLETTAHHSVWMRTSSRCWSCRRLSTLRSTWP